MLMKTVIGIIGGIVVFFSVVALHCVLVIAGRYDKCGDKFCKEQICPKCNTGKYTYELDSKSEICPYIRCWKQNKCPFYTPLFSDKGPKKCHFSGLINKKKRIL